MKIADTTQFLEYFDSLGSEDKYDMASWIPCEKDLLDRGIEFQYIIQKPGDAIYTGYKAVHWVYNPVGCYWSF